MYQVIIAIARAYNLLAQGAAHLAHHASRPRRKPAARLHREYPEQPPIGKRAARPAITRNFLRIVLAKGAPVSGDLLNLGASRHAGLHMRKLRHQRIDVLKLRERSE